MKGGKALPAIERLNAPPAPHAGRGPHAVPTSTGTHRHADESEFSRGAEGSLARGARREKRERHRESGPSEGGGRESGGSAAAASAAGTAAARAALARAPAENHSKSREIKDRPPWPEDKISGERCLRGARGLARAARRRAL